MKKELLLVIKSMKIGLFICPIFYLFGLSNEPMTVYIAASATVLGFYYAWPNVWPILKSYFTKFSQ